MINSKFELPPDIKTNLQIVWDYLRMDNPPEPADAILVLGTQEYSPAIHAADLFNQGWAPVMIITGGTGTRPASYKLFDGSEAEAYAKIAIERGVPKEKIITENRATNTGENFTLAKEIMDSRGIPYNKIIIVQKPFMTRRAFATGKIYFPNTEFIMQSIPLSLTDYLNTLENPLGHINSMLGDLKRIEEYPALGFQIPVEVPPAVRTAHEHLMTHGYGS